MQPAAVPAVACTAALGSDVAFEQVIGVEAA